ncbi:MAG: hypothetical protein RMK99_00390 [Anaerolineales bacterium]|nr:hypothetical protein [Anaerolineales bacterium]
MLFAKHLPPSAGLPRVLALDERAAAELPPEITPARAAPDGEQFDAIVGYAAPHALEQWLPRLRPGGRLILAGDAAPEAALAALTGAGYIHCLVEEHAGLTLFRGERPPHGSSVERIQFTAGSPLPLGEGLGVREFPFIFLLITQTPNKPAWKLAPDEKLEWCAATVLDPANGRPALLAFTSLVKAVAFMQPAVLAGFLSGINKIGKFRAEAAQTWPLPLIVNPNFDDWRAATLGPPLAVDPQAAITGEE